MMPYAPPAQKVQFFYCYTCEKYEPKTSPHYRSQKRRFARRKRARGEDSESPASS
jgi:hypothetical protein